MKFKERKYKYLTKAMRTYLVKLVEKQLDRASSFGGVLERPLLEEIIELLKSDDLIEKKGKN